MTCLCQPADVDAIKSFVARIRRQPSRLIKSPQTLDKWIDEITNYFIDRQTSGFVEGLNNKIKVIKRRCYGILNTNHLFQHIFLDVQGYGLYV